jgi:hypothetical protein
MDFPADFILFASYWTNTADPKAGSSKKSFFERRSRAKYYGLPSQYLFRAINEAQTLPPGGSGLTIR